MPNWPRSSSPSTVAKEVYALYGFQQIETPAMETLQTLMGKYGEEDGWRAFRIQGELDFSLIGILAGISAVLAENKIGIFVVSTYNTDYVLTKADDFERALGLLESRGYGIAR